MIMGVSHITLSSFDIPKDGAFLESIGYEKLFWEKNLDSRPEKSIFMTTPIDRHDLAYYQTKCGLPIELVHYHHSMTPAPSAFQPLFYQQVPQSSNLPDPSDTPLHSLWQDSLELTHVVAAYISEFNMPFWFSNSPTQEGLKAIARYVDNLDATCHFWETALGCRIKKRGQNSPQEPWAVLTLDRPIPNWSFTFVFMESKIANALPHLNDTGFACVAFLTSNLKQERQRLLATGALKSTGIFELVVNQKTLLIEMFRSPTGELIELLEINVHQGTYDSK